MPRRLPSGQQLAAPGKWPTVGEARPADREDPWSLTIGGSVARSRTWGLAELASLSQVSPIVDVHCVTRWSKLAVPFQGVSLATLLEEASPSAEATHLSFVARSERRHSTSLVLRDAIRLGAFVALAVDGEPLSTARGGPIRLITPGRYFYKSVKWLESIVVLEHDRLGYWEREAGYHNNADPTLEQRYIAPNLTKRETAELLARRDFTGRDLLSIDASQRDLSGLLACGAVLRNADFRHCQLSSADFRNATLANARLQQANLGDAVLTNADVEGANFCGARLVGADFRGASMFGATFCDPTGGDADADLDSSTQFDPKQLDALTPEQQSFVETQLGRTRS